MSGTLDEQDFRNLLVSARRDVRSFVQALGHSPSAYVEAVRGRDLSLDQVTATVAERPAPDGRSVECRRGCAHCCHQLVSTMPVEVLVIADVILDWEPARRKALLERLASISTVPATEGNRISKSLPCPLLEGSECQVYENRPSACRALLSYSEAACRKGLQQGHMPAGEAEMIPSPDLPFLVAGALGVGLDAGMVERGLDTERIDLVRGLLIALTDEHAPAKWLAGEEVFKPARIATPASSKAMVSAAIATFDLKD